ncbi:MAG: hypothetical protein E6J20_19395 [Chloroflexi bacterium]|nr:MAG: hypothetical protein E6J20_19395 [Chloroflexota bacterium]
MSKTSGLGDQFLIGGYDLSGEVNALGKISGSLATLDMTPINKSAHVRLDGIKDGGIDFTVLFDPAAGHSHPVLATLPRTDVIAFYLRGGAVGNPAACEVAKQVDYNPSRANDGMLSSSVATVSNGFSIEWGNQLTAGLFTVVNSLTGQNTGFEGGLGNWVAATNNTSTDTSAQAHTGSNSMSMSSTAGGDMTSASCAAGSIAAQGFAVTPGAQVNVQAWVRAAVSARTCSVGVDWYTAGGAFVSTSYGTGAADSAAAWTLVSGTVVAPATAAFARVNVKVAATGGASEVHYVDDVVFLLLPGSYDTGAAASFGAQAYLQVVAFTGTDVTVKVQDSADNVSFADVSGLAFAQTTAAHTAQRIAIANTATVRRYVAATLTTAGGFSALSFAAVIVKNSYAGVTF